MDLPPSSEVFEDRSFVCDFCDVERVHKIAQLLLPGVAAVCVDSTTGDLFHNPVSVAPENQTDLTEYLLQKSESQAAELLLNVEEDHRDIVDIVADLIEEFAFSRRNLIGKISGWLMSESREDRIDDVMQEMEDNAFWLLDRREILAEILLRNLDMGGNFCCRERFDEFEKLTLHRERCNFRPIRCGNDGCKAMFSERRSENHDQICPFKITECEQKCGAVVARREMDRHCITICGMKLVNCPFYQVGCKVEGFPQSGVERHCTEFLHDHLLCALKAIHKQEITDEELELRVKLLEKV